MVGTTADAGKDRRMPRTESVVMREPPERRVLASIDEHIADAAAARGRAIARRMARRQPDPGRRLMLQLADAYVRELRSSRAGGAARAGQ
jgi:hypothetical protein